MHHHWRGVLPIPAGARAVPRPAHLPVHPAEGEPDDGAVRQPRGGDGRRGPFRPEGGGHRARRPHPQRGKHAELHPHGQDHGRVCGVRERAAQIRGGKEGDAHHQRRRRLGPGPGKHPKGRAPRQGQDRGRLEAEARRPGAGEAGQGDDGGRAAAHLARLPQPPAERTLFWAGCVRHVL